MAVRSKTGTARIEHVPGKPKKSRQGDGQHSKRKSKSSRKKSVGQGG